MDIKIKSAAPKREALTITPEAVQQLHRVLEQQGRPDAGLRVFISEGGCSGYSYGMALEDDVQEGDQVVETSGVRLIVDEYSWPHIAGSEIDFVNSLMGGGFTLHNPNAVSSCACGQSFTSGQGGGSARACH
ncbi:MAG TPA: iron-sulfur cluster assembly accessory protein [Dehalococcoidia bacterium]|nr:iron-sulfur cluster assembly accessory protein [Dehalococcoidia bacterium]